MRKDVKIIMAVCVIVLVGLIVYALFLPGEKKSPVATTDNTVSENTTGADNTTTSATQPSDNGVAVAPATQPADETPVAVSPTTMPSENAMNEAAPIQPVPPVAIAPASGDWNKLLSTGSSPPDTGPATTGGGTSVPLSSNPTPTLANNDSTTETPALNTQTSATGQRTYTIKSGDTPSSIALAMYGNRSLYTKILAANPKLNARHMHVGQKITLPDISATATKTQTESPNTTDTNTESGVTPVEPSSPTESATAGGSKYTVVAGDSLQRISVKLYNSSAQWKKFTLYKAKIGSNPARLRVGMVLTPPQAPNASEPPAASSRKHSAASVTPESTTAAPSTTMQ